MIAIYQVIYLKEDQSKRPNRIYITIIGYFFLDQILLSTILNAYMCADCQIIRKYMQYKALFEMTFL